MSDQICLPKSYILIIFCIFIGLAAWYIHNDKKKHIDNINYKFNDSILDIINKKLSDNKQLNKRRFIQNRDHQVLFNNFVAPERRQPEHAYPVGQVRNMINFPTRGLPDNYHQVGLLFRNNTETAFKLFGRQKFPGSNQWEYFVQAVMSNNDVKIPITIRGDREIENGQVIVVPGTDNSKGGFKVKLYNYDLPRYNPYDY
jgi:hypothetical protein